MQSNQFTGKFNLQFYRKNGYWLRKRPLFSQQKFERLHAIFEGHVNNGNVRSDELDVPHFKDHRLFEFLVSEEVMNLVEPVLGPNIGLWSSHFISKEPFSGRATPWHEDSSYWKGRLDRVDQLVTVWLALDPSNKQNGCLRVIPSSHLNGGFSEYKEVDKAGNTFGTAIVQVDESKAVDFELLPNECSLHDGRIVHGAEPNTSPTRRCGYTMRYFSLETRVDPGHKKNKSHRIFYCRGGNIAHNHLEAVPAYNPNDEM